MQLDRDIPWDDCIRVLRRVGFVCAAESPEAVALVGGGRSVLLQRAPTLAEPVFTAALQAAGLRADALLTLLYDTTR